MLKFNDYLKEAKKCTDEELVGKQHKLDVNKNGKLDSDDFKKLRATKEEKGCKEGYKEEKSCKEEDEMEGYVSHAQRKAVWASRNEKGVKEETEYTIEDFSLEEIEEFMMSEEYEQLDELSKKTLASYIPQAAKSARFSGMTSQDMKNRSDRARNQGMKDSFARLSAKYRNKAWKREDNIEKAAQKLAKEEVKLDEAMTPMQKLKDALDRHSEKCVAANKRGDDEACKMHQAYMNKIKAKMAKLAKNEQVELGEEIDILNELSKKTLQSYQSKIGHDLDRAMDAMPHGTGDDKEDRKLNNRMVGDERAQKRLMKMNKEETEPVQADYLSPTLAFLDSLGEGKIDDLKDRMRMKQATQSAFDKDYKPAEKQHSNITVHKGTSYGGQENDDEDEKDEKPEAKEKRGRGRPAGSKSGARV